MAFLTLDHAPGPCALRWAARLAGLFVLAVVAMFVLGEGEARPNPRRMTPREGTLFALLALTLVGMVLGWRWEGLGGAISLGALLLFSALNIIASGRPPGWAFGVLAIPGALLLASWWAHLGRSNVACAHRILP
jgi:hypothetical protein